MIFEPLSTVLGTSAFFRLRKRVRHSREIVRKVLGQQ
jgi:hypothetical protein